MVDCLDLPDPSIPDPEVSGTGEQKPSPVVLGLPEDSVEVLQPGAHAVHHLPALRRPLRARVHGGMEALANLLHAGLQGFSLEEMAIYFSN